MIRNYNYKFINRIIIIVSLLIIITTTLTSSYYIREYKKYSLHSMELVAKNDGEIDELLGDIKNEWVTFAVKIDNADNILEIVNNNNFGVERDIYRIVRTNKDQGTGFINAQPIRFLKEKKEYGEIIIFNKRDIEVENINRAIITIMKVMFTSTLFIVASTSYNKGALKSK